MAHNDWIPGKGTGFCGFMPKIDGGFGGFRENYRPDRLGSGQFHEETARQGRSGGRDEGLCPCFPPFQQNCCGTRLLGEVNGKKYRSAY
jgi:hypothetical protein